MNTAKIIAVTQPRVLYIDHMGDDKAVVNAARVSFANDLSYNEFSDKDEKLIKYLAKNNHWSPFAHTAIKLKVKAPIFIARQLVKHQVGGVWNEVSRRYVDFPPEFFLPDDVRGRPINTKQGSSDVILDKSYITKILESYEQSLQCYNELINDGVCPEQARMVLPLGCMTDWYWTGSLIFWARVYKQRSDPHAQKEASHLAAQIDEIISELFPFSWRELILSQ
jgi:thymidylate synthase (FAD)